MRNVILTIAFVLVSLVGFNASVTSAHAGNLREAYNSQYFGKYKQLFRGGTVQLHGPVARAIYCKYQKLQVCQSGAVKVVGCGNDYKVYMGSNKSRIYPTICYKPGTIDMSNESIVVAGERYIVGSNDLIPLN